MDFERSTQAHSWMFDEESLSQCRAKMISGRTAEVNQVGGGKKVRKFASGFHAVCLIRDAFVSPRPDAGPKSTQSTLSADEQDIMVRFHAHQITMLIGPHAVLPSLRRSPTVLATAVMFFRRFYLSNSVLDIKPRSIAVAAAFLAAKVEEQKVEIDVLEHATDIIHQTVKGAPLCRQELCYVTVEEIEVAERQLMEGINFQMRCHHPYNAVRVLAKELDKFTGRSCSSKNFERRGPCNESSSPRTVFDVYSDDEEDEHIKEHALLVSQNALLFSDVPFLFPPGQIAFAAVAMAMSGSGGHGGLPLSLRTYLRDRFVSKSETQLLAFEDQVSAIVHNLRTSPVMDMKMLELSRTSFVCDKVVAEQASELRRVLGKVATIRGTRLYQPIFLAPRDMQSHKRKRSSMTLPSPSRRVYRKIVKVTPTKLQYSQG